MPGLIGRKLCMTRVIQEDGKILPVTVISVPDATVTQVKTVDKDGYDAVVLGIEPLPKPTKTKKFRLLKEFSFSPLPEKGKTLSVDLLKDIAEVTIRARTKGLGTAGVVKRFHFAGGPGSHGHAGKAKHGGIRKTGSVGARAKPGRIKKGKRFPGRHGYVFQTRHHVPLVKVDPQAKLIAVKAPIPGAMRNPVYIQFKTA